MKITLTYDVTRIKDVIQKTIRGATVLKAQRCTKKYPASCLIAVTQEAIAQSVLTGNTEGD